MLNYLLRIKLFAVKWLHKICESVHLWRFYSPHFSFSGQKSACNHTFKCGVFRWFTFSSHNAESNPFFFIAARVFWVIASGFLCIKLVRNSKKKRKNPELGFSWHCNFKRSLKGTSVKRGNLTTKARNAACCRASTTKKSGSFFSYVTKKNKSNSVRLIRRKQCVFRSKGTV